MQIASTEKNKQNTINYEFIHPKNTDGYDVNQLVHNCKPLDENSAYCNLLQCEHFSDTSICTKVNNELVAFVSGYIPPNKPNTLFIWQVATSEKHRGNGLGARMIQEILKNPICSNIQFIETTITESNKSSQRLFTKLANNLSTKIKSHTYFQKEVHFNGLHDSEELYVIGPFERK